MLDQEKERERFEAWFEDDGISTEALATARAAWLARAALDGAQGVGEPVAWQWRARRLAEDTWGGWEPGRIPAWLHDHPSYVVAERPLYAAPPQPSDTAAAFIPTHRHLKRGSVYRVIGEAEAQVSIGEIQMTLEDGACRILCEGDYITVYQEEGGKLWFRFPDEFNDGRFEPVAANETASVSDKQACVSPADTNAAAFRRGAMTDVQWLKRRTAETGEVLKGHERERFLSLMRFAERALDLPSGEAE